MAFCPECGTQNSDNVKFCGNCGTQISSPETNQQNNQQDYTQPQSTQQDSKPQYGTSNPNVQSGQVPYQQNSQNYQYTPPSSPMYTNQAQYPPQGFYQRSPDYIRPADYVFTETMSQRIIGTIKRDVHVVEEIEEREDLNDEANRLLILNFTLLTIFQLIGIFGFTGGYIVYSPIGTVLEVVLVIFGTGFLYIRMIAGVGKSIGGQGTNTDSAEMQRVLSYAYVAYVISEFLYIISNIVNSLLVDLVWVVVFFYSFIVFIFAVRRALDKGFGTALITVIIAYVGKLIAATIITIILESIFGGTYS